MFRNTYQTGFISVLYSIGSDPFQIWDVKSDGGSVERIRDEELKSSVIELKGANLATTYIRCPKKHMGPHSSLGINLPYLIVLMKNQGEPFSLEVQVLDSKNHKRRFRASTYQKASRTSDSIVTMPLKLSNGWNHIQFDLADFLRRGYSTGYRETVGIQIHSSCRLRRVYFTDKSYSEEELPPEFKIFIPS
jgi:hypothetical protein